MVVVLEEEMAEQVQTIREEAEAEGDTLAVAAVPVVPV